jgi:hypothetical protein
LRTGLSAAKPQSPDLNYRTAFPFPDRDAANPEIGRLWALDQIERLERRANAGEMPEGEADGAIRELGLRHQIVTGETSMLVVADEAFTRHGVARENLARFGREETARHARAAQPVPVSRRIDDAVPLTPGRAPSIYRPSGGGGGGGGGALPPFAVFALAPFSSLAVRPRPRQAVGA